jgi:small subunit ribosomal protein S20
VAQHKSALKRARQSLRRRERNRHQRGRAKRAIKKAREALSGGDPEATQTALRSAESVLRRTASKGVIPKKRASRQVSRLARRANQTS